MLARASPPQEFGTFSRVTTSGTSAPDFGHLGSDPEESGRRALLDFAGSVPPVHSPSHLRGRFLGLYSGADAFSLGNQPPRGTDRKTDARRKIKPGVRLPFPTRPSSESSRLYSRRECHETAHLFPFFLLQCSTVSQFFSLSNGLEQASSFKLGLHTSQPPRGRRL